MSQVKGTIEAVSCKEGNEHPTYGKSWQTSIKVNDVWYGAFTKKDADGLGLSKGKLVTFTFTENGKYKNFDPKSLVVSASQAAPAAAPAAGKSGYSGNYGSNGAGIKVGHAINNAVQLAIAKGDTSLKAIHGHAVDILALSVKLEGQFEQIVARSDSVIQKAGANAGQPAAEAPAPAATGKTAAPKTRKKAAAPTPPPPPAAEVEEEAPPVEVPAQAEPSFDDDDIPF